MWKRINDLISLGFESRLGQSMLITIVVMLAPIALVIGYFSRRPYSDRWKHQFWYAKVYRWLRWQPWYIVKCLRVIFWSGWAPYLEYSYIKSRWEYMRHQLTIVKSLRDFRMGRVYTLEELKDIGTDEILSRSRVH